MSSSDLTQQAPKGSDWMFENTVSCWVQQEGVNQINRHLDLLQGKLLTLQEAILPEGQQLKAAKDMIKNILQDVRLEMYNYNNFITERLAKIVDEAENDAITQGKLDYKYSRSKIQ